MVTTNKIKLGTLIQPANEPNKKMLLTKKEDVVGVSIDKEFMPSVANLNGTDLSKYCILRKNRFAYNPMHVGRDKRLPIALYKEDTPALVSPAYNVFEVKDGSPVILDYLMLVFKTDLFDKLCWFPTDSSVRGGLSYSDFCNIEINLPTVTDQERMVYQYDTIVNRIDILERLNGKLNKLLTNYFNDFLQKNEYQIQTIADYGEVVTGKTPSMSNKEYYNSMDVPFIKTPDMHNGIFVCETTDYLSYAGANSQKTKYLDENTVIMTCIGSAGVLGITTQKSQTNQQINAVKTEHTELLYLLLRKFIPELLILGDGSTTMTNINKTDFEKFPMPMFKESRILEIEEVIKPIFKTIRDYEMEIFKLKQIKQLLISKI